MGISAVVHKGGSSQKLGIERDVAALPTWHIQEDVGNLMTKLCIPITIK